MKKIASLLAIVLILPLVLRPQSADERRTACIQRCIAFPLDPEVERQEIVALEKEAVHAIQLGDVTFFRRTYSDDFRGTLSHGETVDKAEFINLVQSSPSKDEFFTVSDIKVRIYRDTAVATCLWSSHRTRQFAHGPMRVIHMYVNGPMGWKLVSSQHTEIELPELWTAHAFTEAIASF